MWSFSLQQVVFLYRCVDNARSYLHAVAPEYRQAIAIHQVLFGFII